jgi:hypothetical protein
MSEEDHAKPRLRQWVGYLVLLILFLVVLFSAGAFVDYLLLPRTRRQQGDRTEQGREKLVRLGFAPLRS